MNQTLSLCILLLLVVKSSPCGSHTPYVHATSDQRRLWVHSGLKERIIGSLIRASGALSLDLGQGRLQDTCLLATNM